MLCSTNIWAKYQLILFWILYPQIVLYANVFQALDLIPKFGDTMENKPAVKLGPGPKSTGSKMELI